MKTIIAMLISAFLLPLQTTAFASSQDEAKIKSLIESFGVLADKSLYSELEKIFATHVLVDYSSLNGNAPATVAAKDLMTQWASVLPGFDLTRHDVSNIEVEIKGNRARATAKVVADHYINELFWQVEGGYLYQLERQEDTWKITELTFNLKKEKGTRDVFGPASENAKTSPNAYMKYKAAEKDALSFNKPDAWLKPENPVAKGSENNANLKVVQNFFAAYSKGDMDGIKAVMADDVQWHIPGKHPLSGTKNGISEVMVFFNKISKAGFKAEVMILAANDNYVIDAHRGWSNTGDNDIDTNWILLYKVENGKIKRVQNFSGDLYGSDEFFHAFFNE